MCTGGGGGGGGNVLFVLGGGGGNVLFVLGIMIIGCRLEAFDLYIRVAVAGTTSP